MTASVPFSFVHCADLHLDSPFEGIHAAAPAIAAVLREATFTAFDRIIDLAKGKFGGIHQMGKSYR